MDQQTIEYEKLDHLSALFGRAFFAQYPQWERYGSQVKCFRGDEQALKISVPQPGGDRILELTTDQEITVAFGQWHIHCTPFSDVEDIYSKAVEQAMQSIDEIVLEKIVFERKNAGYWASHVKPSSVAPVESSASLEVYSWLGTYNRR